MSEEQNDPQVTQERNSWSQVPHWLLKAAKPAAVVVYAQLAAYAWMKDGARPAIRRVADDLGMSESTVKRCIQELSEIGAVVVEHRSLEGVQLPSRYHLKLTRGGGGFTTEPRVGSPVTYEEEGLKKKEDTPPPAPPSERVDPITSDFEAWWAAYPKKVGKKNALTKYRAARKRASADVLLQGVRGYKFSPERQYQPDPATWLGQDRWEDVRHASAPAADAPAWMTDPVGAFNRGEITIEQLRSATTKTVDPRTAWMHTKESSL